MSGRIVYIARIMIVLSIAMTASAANDWTNNARNGNWNTAGNWTNGIPTMTADIYGDVGINQAGSNACTIDGTGAQAVCQWLHIGVSAAGTLNVVAGGKIGTPAWGPGQSWVGQGYAGTLNIDGAGSVAKSEQWNIGSASSGVVNITNGGELIGALWGNYIGAAGTVNIINGTMTIQGEADFVINDGGVIDISEGSLVMDGDRTALINGYIAAGKIKGKGITGHVKAAIVSDQTVVTYQKPAKELMPLRRGVTFDRQFHEMPVASYCVIHSADAQLVKKMGFDFAKVLINPALMMNSDGTINTANVGYVDELVNTFLNEGVPVVVCLHPESDFKNTYLGIAANFPKLLAFYHDFAAYLSSRWGRNQLAFELMTEPYGNYTSWNTMLPQMWLSARKGMPDNILILDADGVADIGHLVQLTPVNDDNVYYSFTTYAPWVFTFQGAYWMTTNYLYAMQRVPYPSSPEIIAAEKPRILAFLSANGYSTSGADADLTTYGNDRWNKSKQLEMVAPLVAWNNAHGGNRKIFCAEFGVLDNKQSSNMTGYDSGCDPATRIQFIKDRRQAFEESNISWSYWSFNEAFTVLDPMVRVTFDSNPTTSCIDNPTMDALGLTICGCGCRFQPSSPSDLNKDCYVDILDLAEFAGSWLGCTEPTDARCL